MSEKSKKERSQAERFKEAARETGADADEDEFDRVLGKVARDGQGEKSNGSKANKTD